MQPNRKCFAFANTTLFISLAAFFPLAGSLNSEALAQLPLIQTPVIPSAPASSLSPISPQPAPSVPALTPIPPVPPQQVPIPAPAPIAVPILAPIPARSEGSLSPIQTSIPSFSVTLPSNGSSLSPIRNNPSGNVFSIEIPCQNLVENPQQKLAACEKFLAVHRRMGDQAGEGATLNNMGLIYRELGNYPQAIILYQQGLAIHQRLKNRAGEAASLNNIGLTYHERGEYAQALTFYQQALTIHREIGNRESEGRTLNNLGELYRQLGQYSQALVLYNQALEVVKATSDRVNIGNTLHNIGLLYESQKNYPEALKFYQQSFTIRQEIGDKVGEGITLNNMGLVYNQLGNQFQALESLQQALAIFKQLGNRVNIGNTLDSIGTVYKSLGQYSPALDSYRQALVILREVGNREIERVTLSNIGAVLEKQNQPELAIVFYKQSVNVTEIIRDNLKQLPSERDSYTQTVADTYRTLADLLLSQGRIIEAQQVLELLKVQEIRDYTRNGKAGGENAGIPFNQIEAKIINTYGSLIAFGQRVDECKRTECSQLNQLNEQLQSVTEQYNQIVQSLKKEISDRTIQDPAFFDPTKSAKAAEIVEYQPNTVLIYPFVLEDKIWLLWASKGGIIKSVEVPVSRRKLGETVLKFRQSVQDLTVEIDEIQATGKQLYDWLIKPLEPELKANNIQNLVFSLDRMTRYIPMSALYDGKQYLIENYAVSTVLSADLTDVRDRLPPNTQNTPVLALGVSNAVAGFTPLPNVPAELDAVVRQNPNDSQGIYPGLKFLNHAFDLGTLRNNLQGRKILHIATHADFVRGRPEDSYLLLGTGEKLTIPQIETLKDLSNVHLVVLSACETALGGPDQDGVEIAGISYYFLNRGAKAVIASLWLVNDYSTSLLMQNFYRNLANDTGKTPLTKTEALRQAQLNMLHGNTSTIENVAQSPRLGSQLPATPSIGMKFSHPYYWAPFILIGNGL